MSYELPIDVEIDGAKHKIRNGGDYRVILDVIAALKDEELSTAERVQCALYIFYENINEIDNIQAAIDGMMLFLNNGEEDTKSNTHSEPIMDWNHDFKILVAPLNKILGVEIRSIPYLHWWTFIGAYMEIGEGTFNTVVSIRNKLLKHQKLEKWENEFYQKNKKMVDLPSWFTKEEQEYLESDW